MAAKASQAAFAGNEPDGRCARGPSARSAKTCAARQTAQRYTWLALARQVAAVYMEMTGKPRPA